jgi:hypothetical protein
MHGDQNRWRRFNTVAIKMDAGNKTFLSSLYLIRKVKLECSARCREDTKIEEGGGTFGGE